MKIHFTNATDAPWEFTLADAGPGGFTPVPLPPGFTAAHLDPAPGAWLLFGPQGDGFPHGLSRRFTADDAHLVATLYVAPLQIDGPKTIEALYQDAPPPTEDN